MKAQESKALRRLTESLTTGNLWLPILSLLKKRDCYAYEIPKLIRKQFGFDMNLIMGYLVLYKMEADGLISSYHKERKKYYKTTPFGRKELEKGKKLLSKTAIGFG